MQCVTHRYLYIERYFFFLPFFPCSVVFCYIFFTVAVCLRLCQLFYSSGYLSFVLQFCVAQFSFDSRFIEINTRIYYTHDVWPFVCAVTAGYSTLFAMYDICCCCFFVFRVLFLFTCDQIASCCIFLDVANSYARFFTNSPNYFSAAVLSSSSLELLLFLLFFLPTIPWFFPTLDCISLLFQFVFFLVISFQCVSCNVTCDAMWCAICCKINFKQIFCSSLCTFFAAGFCFRKANGF